MKHFLLATCFTSLSLVGISQGDMPESDSPTRITGRPAVISGDRALPFWEEDFAGGFPAGWAIIDSSGICPWTYSTDGSYGFFSGGGITVGDDPLASTTGANGFLICDNDSANHFNYGQPSGTNYQYLSSYFGTSAIDCSSHSSVILRFEHAYRYNNSVAMYVQVSTDSTNWTAFNVSGGLANNTASANPDIEVLNLSAIAGNEATVYLRFGWDARVYFWMIDDISLSESDPNDVVMGNGFWGTGTYQYQYYRIPEVQNPVVTFYGPLANNTGSAMNDAYFEVDVSDGATVFSGTSNLLDLIATEVDTAVSTTDWTPVATTEFEVAYEGFVTGLTDGNLANNNFMDTIEITYSLYSLDDAELDGSDYSGGISNWSGNTGMSFGIGNVYEVLEDAMIGSVQVGVTSNAANEGNVIYAAVYYYDGSEWIYVEASGDYQVTNADLGKVITLEFSQCAEVTAGQEILVLACHYGGTDVEFMMAQGVPAGMVHGFDGANDWYYLNAPSAIVCRPDLLCPLSLQESGIANSMSCFPNPASEAVFVSFDLGQASLVEMDVLDLNGKLIYSGTPTQLNAGHSQLSIPVEALPAGVYTVRARINDSFVFEKIVIR